MTITLKESLEGALFFLPFIGAKALRADRWYSNQLSQLELAKRILSSGGMREASGKTLLTKYIQRKNIQVKFIEALSKPSLLQTGIVFALLSYVKK